MSGITPARKKASNGFIFRSRPVYPPLPTFEDYESDPEDSIIYRDSETTTREEQEESHQRILEAATKYVRGEGLYLHSARLKGPVVRNPWANSTSRSAAASRTNSKEEQMALKHRQEREDQRPAKRARLGPHGRQETESQHSIADSLIASWKAPSSIFSDSIGPPLRSQVGYSKSPTHHQPQDGRGTDLTRTVTPRTPIPPEDQSRVSSTGSPIPRRRTKTNPTKTPSHESSIPPTSPALPPSLPKHVSKHHNPLGSSPFIYKKKAKPAPLPRKRLSSTPPPSEPELQPTTTTIQPSSPAPIEPHTEPAPPLQTTIPPSSAKPTTPFESSIRSYTDVEKVEETPVLSRGINPLPKAYKRSSLSLPTSAVSETSEGDSTATVLPATTEKKRKRRHKKKNKENVNVPASSPPPNPPKEVEKEGSSTPTPQPPQQEPQPAEEQPSAPTSRQSTPPPPTSTWHPVNPPSTTRPLFSPRKLPPPKSTIPPLLRPSKLLEKALFALQSPTKTPQKPPFRRLSPTSSDAEEEEEEQVLVGESTFEAADETWVTEPPTQQQPAETEKPVEEVVEVGEKTFSKADESWVTEGRTTVQSQTQVVEVGEKTFEEGDGTWVTEGRTELEEEEGDVTAVREEVEEEEGDVTAVRVEDETGVGLEGHLVQTEKQTETETGEKREEEQEKEEPTKEDIDTTETADVEIVVEDADTTKDADTTIEGPETEEKHETYTRAEVESVEVVEDTIVEKEAREVVREVVEEIVEVEAEVADTSVSVVEPEVQVEGTKEEAEQEGEQVATEEDIPKAAVEEKAEQMAEEGPLIPEEAVGVQEEKRGEEADAMEGVEHHGSQEKVQEVTDNEPKGDAAPTVEPVAEVQTKRFSQHLETIQEENESPIKRPVEPVHEMVEDAVASPSHDAHSIPGHGTQIPRTSPAAEEHPTEEHCAEEQPAEEDHEPEHDPDETADSPSRPLVPATPGPSHDAETDPDQTADSPDRMDTSPVRNTPARPPQVESTTPKDTPPAQPQVQQVVPETPFPNQLQAPESDAMDTSPIWKTPGPPPHSLPANMSTDPVPETPAAYSILDPMATSPIRASPVQHSTYAENQQQQSQNQHFHHSAYAENHPSQQLPHQDTVVFSDPASSDSNREEDWPTLHSQDSPGRIDFFRESQQQIGTQDSPWVDTQFQLQKARKLFEAALMDTPAGTTQDTAQTPASLLISPDEPQAEDQDVRRKLTRFREPTPDSQPFQNTTATTATPMQDAQGGDMPMSIGSEARRPVGPSQDTWLGTQVQLDRERESFDRNFLMDTPAVPDTPHIPDTPHGADSRAPRRIEETPAIVHMKKKKQVKVMVEAKRNLMEVDTPQVDTESVFGKPMDKFAWALTDTPTAPKKPLKARAKSQVQVPEAPVKGKTKRKHKEPESGFDDAFKTPAPRKQQRPVPDAGFTDAFKTPAPAPRGPKKGGVNRAFDPDMAAISTPLLPDSPFKTFDSPPPHSSPTARYGNHSPTRQNKRAQSPVPINLFTQVDGGKANIFDTPWQPSTMNMSEKWPFNVDKENQLTPDQGNNGFMGFSDSMVEDEGEDLLRDVTKMLDDEVWDIEKEISTQATPVQPVNKKMQRSAKIRSIGREGAPARRRW